MLIVERVIFKHLRSFDRRLVQSHQVGPVHQILPDQVAFQVGDLLQTCGHHGLRLSRHDHWVVVNLNFLGHWLLCRKLNMAKVLVRNAGHHVQVVGCAVAFLVEGADQTVQLLHLIGDAEGAGASVNPSGVGLLASAVDLVASAACRRLDPPLFIVVVQMPRNLLPRRIFSEVLGPSEELSKVGRCTIWFQIFEDSIEVRIVLLRRVVRVNAYVLFHMRVVLVHVAKHAILMPVSLLLLLTG